MGARTEAPLIADPILSNGAQAQNSMPGFPCPEHNHAPAFHDRSAIAEAIDIKQRALVFLSLVEVWAIGLGCQQNVLLAIQKYYGRIRVRLILRILLTPREIEAAGTIILVLIENRLKQRACFVPLPCTHDV